MKKVAAVLTALLLLGQPGRRRMPDHRRGIPDRRFAAVVIDAESGEVLFAQEPHRRLPMASTTKIMTAWLALEQPDLYQEFTVDANALHVEGSSMGLQAGDTVTLYAPCRGHGCWQAATMPPAAQQYASAEARKPSPRK